jgi:hypothetical protein
MNLGAETKTDTQPATTSTMSTASSAFNKNATEFVPKGKIVKTVEAFPTLGEGLTKEPAKKKAAPVVQTQ